MNRFKHEAQRKMAGGPFLRREVCRAWPGTGQESQKGLFFKRSDLMNLAEPRITAPPAEGTPLLRLRPSPLPARWPEPGELRLDLLLRF